MISRSVLLKYPRSSVIAAFVSAHSNLLATQRGHPVSPRSAAISSRLEDYAMLGDCQSAALVSRGGAIDWLWWPRFDSGACFAALLGDPEHGRWLLTAVDASVRIKRRYRDDTLILETDLETAQG